MSNEPVSRPSLSKINSMPDQITSFSNEYRFLSNFYPSPVSNFDGTYPTVEHAYQAMKTLNRDARLEIAKAVTPCRAKALGQKVKIRSDWESLKDLIMLSLLRQKFMRGTILAEKLLATGDAKLIEGNIWNGTYWGQCPLGNGRNMLGKLLMQVREELRR